MQEKLMLSNASRNSKHSVIKKFPEYPIKIIRSDNGSNLCSHEAEKWYAENGITHQVTVPYSSQQNGRAERAIRDIRSIVVEL